MKMLLAVTCAFGALATAALAQNTMGAGATTTTQSTTTSSASKSSTGATHHAHHAIHVVWFNAHVYAVYQPRQQSACFNAG